MSYRELTMTEIREVLRRWQATQSLHQIARETGLDRNTVRRHVRAAEASGLSRRWQPGNDAAIGRVMGQVQARPAVEVTEEWQAVESQRSQIEAWLGGDRPLKLRKIHTPLQRRGIVAGPLPWSRMRAGYALLRLCDKYGAERGWIAFRAASGSLSERRYQLVEWIRPSW